MSPKDDQACDEAETTVDATPVILALEDGTAWTGAQLLKLLDHSPQVFPSALQPSTERLAVPRDSAASERSQVSAMVSTLTWDDPMLRTLAPSTGQWRELQTGIDGNVAEAPELRGHAAGHMDAGRCDQLQLVLYQQRELVLFDRRQNRVFARRLTEEQATSLTRNRRSVCPLCHQRLSPSWAFVVEGYFDLLSSSSAFGSGGSNNEEAAAASGLHSIPPGLLNSGYYARFFTEERKLGSGSFGAVYLCRHMMEDIELGVFAVKKLALGDDAKRLRQVVREVKALERLRHLNIVDYKHSWLEVSRHSLFCPLVPFLFILMEFCNAGSLEDLIWPSGFVRGANNSAHAPVLATKLIWLLFLDICRGLQHLHNRGILHRDLKPSNILLHVDEPAIGGSRSGSALVPRAMLSDFGTCEILGDGILRSHVHGGYAIEFMAPERLHGEDSDEPADMWSAGLVLFAMCSGDLPYHSEEPERCRERVMAHSRLPPLVGRETPLCDLVDALTSRDPALRPTAMDAERAASAAVRETERPVQSPCLVPAHSATEQDPPMLPLPDWREDAADTRVVSASSDPSMSPASRGSSYM